MPTNIFGDNMPTIIIAETYEQDGATTRSTGVEYQLPTTTRNGRHENFEKVVGNSWVDLNDITHERIKGYRLVASYDYERLINDDFETLLDIYNESKKTASIRIRFATIPIEYPVRVVGWDHGIYAGYTRYDSAKIEFEGVTIVKEFPNPDNIYNICPWLNGIIVIE